MPLIHTHKQASQISLDHELSESDEEAALPLTNPAAQTPSFSNTKELFKCASVLNIYEEG